MSLTVKYYVGSTIYYLAPLLTQLSWSGETTIASRSCSLTLNNTTNGTTKAVNITPGNQIRAYLDGKEFFRGIIFSTDIKSDGTMNVTAYDYNHYLAKNTDSKVFRKMKASAIIQSICKSYGIDYGHIDDTTYVIPKLILRDKSLFDMITIALTETRKKTGKVFLLGNEGGKLVLRERKNQVNRLVIADGSNILSASYSQSIDDLRNSVRITGKSGEDAKGVTVSDSASIKNYGLMREKQHEGEKTDAQLKPIANALLKELNKVERESNVEALGEISVYAGKQVNVSEKMTGISGGFYVITDEHTFDPNGKHMMRLTVSKTLEVAEMEYEPPEEPKKQTASKSSASINAPADSGNSFRRPTSGTLTQNFGRGRHYGIDIAAGGKVAIVAAAAGKVVRSYRSSSYGECIILRHHINGKQYETVYAHMRSGSRQYRTGQSVERGALLGYMGNTGQSTGQHLHFEIHSPSWNAGKTNALNPSNYI